MRKTTILTITFISLLALPAVAQVGYVWDDIQSYATDLRNYINNNIGNTVEPVLITQTSINTTTGKLNIPDPLAAGQQVSDNIIFNSLRENDKFENNSTVYSNLLSNEILRLITRGAATGVLGEAGQRRTQNKLEQTQNNVKAFIEDSNTQNQLQQAINSISGIGGGTFTGSMTSTSWTALLTANQENLQIQKEQLKVNTESFAQSVRLEQSLQYTNLNLANLSQQFEENNRARRVDSATEAARLLRVSSQTDLFGRKYDEPQASPTP